MTSCTYNCLMNVINIGNSIIGVSILAMPYCFRKCGILLSVVLIFVSGCLTRLACYLLLKSAIKARRRNFEFLAFHTFGSTGKLAVEMSVIGFLIGVCIAFFVVIGDLGPPLAAEFLQIEESSNLRTNVLILVGLCAALPLGLLRNIDSLTSLSAFSIAFYLCLILKIFAEAVPNLAANEWWNEVNWWRSDGILPCLPIFSMALSCQTQLFEFFDTTNDPSLKRMQTVISGAVHLCSAVYIMVGTLGYIAFHDKTITGNVLLLLTSSAITEIIKFGFIITLAVSFPLCLFPCRSSLHSLLFKQGFGHHELNVTVIPENRFRILTVSLVIVTIGIAIMLPNIEFVLGIIGSTIGTLICLIFPALMFIHDTSKNTTEKRMAQVLMGIGAFILIACTYSTLNETTSPAKPVAVAIKALEKVTPETLVAIPSSTISGAQVPIVIVPLKEELSILDKEKEKKTVIIKPPEDQKRLEPPIPQEPEQKIQADPHADLDPQALQKEDKELQKENPSSSNAADAKKDKSMDKHEKLLQKLEEQHQEQKLILEQQKKVLEELKLHKEIHAEKQQQQVPDLEPLRKPDPQQVRETEPEVRPLLREDSKGLPAGVDKEHLRVNEPPIAPPVKNIERLPEKIQNVAKNETSEPAKGVEDKIPLNLPSKSDGDGKLMGNQPQHGKSIAEKPIVFNNSNANVVPNFVAFNGNKDSKAFERVKEKVIEKVIPTERVANSFDTRINQREPLENKDDPEVQGNGKDVRIDDLLLGAQKVQSL